MPVGVECGYSVCLALPHSIEESWIWMGAKSECVSLCQPVHPIASVFTLLGLPKSSVANMPGFYFPVQAAIDVCWGCWGWVKLCHMLAPTGHCSSRAHDGHCQHSRQQAVWTSNHQALVGYSHLFQSQRCTSYWCLACAPPSQYWPPLSCSLPQLSTHKQSTLHTVQKLLIAHSNMTPSLTQCASVFSNRTALHDRLPKGTSNTLLKRCHFRR